MDGNWFNGMTFPLFIDIWEDEQRNMIDFDFKPQLRCVRPADKNVGPSIYNRYLVK